MWFLCAFFFVRPYFMCLIKSFKSLFCHSDSVFWGPAYCLLLWVFHISVFWVLLETIYLSIFLLLVSISISLSMYTWVRHLLRAPQGEEDDFYMFVVYLFLFFFCLQISLFFILVVIFYLNFKVLYYTLVFFAEFVWTRPLSPSAILCFMVVFFIFFFFAWWARRSCVFSSWRSFSWIFALYFYFSNFAIIVLILKFLFLFGFSSYTILFCFTVIFVFFLFWYFLY